jgi:flagellar motor protein MotB
MRPESEMDPDPSNTEPSTEKVDIPLDELLLMLKEQIETSEAFKDSREQLKLDITFEGLRIQLIDDEERPMFDLGRANLKPLCSGDAEGAWLDDRRGPKSRHCRRA